MANMYGIDLGASEQTAQDLIGARIKNIASGNALDQMQKTQDATAAAAAPIPGPIGALAAVDPAGASRMHELISGLSTDQRTQFAQNTDQIGRAAAYVEAGTDDADKANRYMQVKGLISQSNPGIAAKMPPTYDQNFVHLALTNATASDAILNATHPEGKSDLGKLAQDYGNGLFGKPGTPQADEVYQSGVAKATAVSAGGDGAPSGFSWTDPGRTSLKFTPGGPHDPKVIGVDPAASNSIRSSVALLYGGTFGPDGTISGINQNQALDVVNTMSAAEAFVKAGMPINQAVQAAVKQVGAPKGGDASSPASAGIQGATDKDPLGLGF